MVKRAPCCIRTSNSLALTMLTIPHYWFIENQNGFTNESRNAMVLAYNLLIYSEVIFIREKSKTCLGLAYS
ncbi:hypothetical protein NMG60_11001081 [Bertholletia excelsa]